MKKKGIKIVAATLAVAGVVGAIAVGGNSANASKSETKANTPVEAQEETVNTTVDKLLDEGASQEELSLAYISLQIELCQIAAQENGTELNVDEVIEQLDKKAAEYEVESLKSKPMMRGEIQDNHDASDLDPSEYYDWGIFNFLNIPMPYSKFYLKDAIYDFHEIVDVCGDWIKEGYSAWKSFNKEQKKLVVKYPLDALTAYQQEKEARGRAIERYGSCELGTKEDAFRQAYWALCNTSLMDKDLAVEFVIASAADEDAEYKEMVSNNAQKAAALRPYHTYEGKEVATLMTYLEMYEAIDGIFTNDANGLIWVK